MALATWARALAATGELAVDDVVPAARSVLFDGVADPGRLRDLLARWQPGERPVPGELVEIPVRYDGADLSDVAQRWGPSVDEAVRAHGETDYVAVFCGFSPGFSYLAGLPEELHRAPPGLPACSGAGRCRWPSPASWCASIPTASPGGWRLLGHTDAALWDQTREPPALLPPGTRVRFVPR